MTKKILLQTLLIILLLLIFKDSLISILSAKNYNECSAEILEIELLKNTINEKSALYDEISKLNDYKENMLNEDYLITKVLLRNQSAFYHDIIVKYGQDKELSKNMAIVSAEGLIGVIDKTEENHSFVKLLTSGEISISVRIGEAYGLISGYKDGYIIVNKVNNFENIIEDDEVVTSNYGNLPENIKIGIVKKIENDNLGIEKILYVESAVDFNNIRYAYIIKQLGDL